MPALSDPANLEGAHALHDIQMPSDRSHLGNPLCGHKMSHKCMLKIQLDKSAATNVSLRVLFDGSTYAYRERV